MDKIFEAFTYGEKRVVLRVPEVVAFDLAGDELGLGEVVTIASWEKYSLSLAHLINRSLIIVIKRHRHDPRTS